MASSDVLTRFTAGTVSGLARMGDFGSFSVKVLRAMPSALRRYPGEYMNHLSDIAWGTGALLVGGAIYCPDFPGPTGDPQFGRSPETFFIPQAGSPAIDAGRPDPTQHQDQVRDGRPDLGAIEAGTTIDDWRRDFGHCGPRWIDAGNAAAKAPLRPAWPKELDPRWGGLD